VANAIAPCDGGHRILSTLELTIRPYIRGLCARRPSMPFYGNTWKIEKANKINNAAGQGVFRLANDKAND
jgi:hypothetical protein